MRDYEYLPASQRKLAEQLDEEDFKREERTRELKRAKGSALESLEFMELVLAENDDSPFYLYEIEENLKKIEESIVEVLNKYN